jgi:hypothetical protein
VILRESAKPADDGASNRLQEFAQLTKARTLLATISKPNVQALAALIALAAPERRRRDDVASPPVWRVGGTPIGRRTRRDDGRLFGVAAVGDTDCGVPRTWTVFVKDPAISRNSSSTKARRAHRHRGPVQRRGSVAHGSFIGSRPTRSLAPARGARSARRRILSLRPTRMMRRKMTTAKGGR